MYAITIQAITIQTIRIWIIAHALSRNVQPTGGAAKMTSPKIARIHTFAHMYMSRSQSVRTPWHVLHVSAHVYTHVYTHACAQAEQREAQMAELRVEVAPMSTHMLYTCLYTCLCAHPCTDMCVRHLRAREHAYMCPHVSTSVFTHLLNPGGKKNALRHACTCLHTGLSMSLHICRHCCL